MRNINRFAWPVDAQGIEHGIIKIKAMVKFKWRSRSIGHNVYEGHERLCLSVGPTRVTVIATPSQLRIREGVDASFICQVDGDQRHRFSWSRRIGVSISAVCSSSMSTIDRVHNWVLGNVVTFRIWGNF